MNFVPEPYLPDHAIKGHLGALYIQACALACGFGWKGTEADQDYDSIDLEVNTRKALCPESLMDSCALAIQAKCTQNLALLISGEEFSYKLEWKNFRDLAHQRRQAPGILVVVKTHPLLKDRITFEESRLQVFGSAYWVNLKTKDPEPAVHPADKTIRIPSRNLLTPQSLYKLLTIVSKYEDLPTSLSEEETNGNH